MRRGFTILEVLVALSIFGLAGVYLTSSYLNILNGYARTRELLKSDQDVRYARATLLAQTDPTVITAGDDFTSIDGRRVQWIGEIVATDVADLFEVTFTCTVSAANNGEPTGTTETFRVLRPTWSTDTGQRTQLQNDARQRIRDLNTASNSP